jgi:hypothetical protein
LLLKCLLLIIGADGRAGVDSGGHFEELKSEPKAGWNEEPSCTATQHSTYLRAYAAH